MSGYTVDEETIRYAIRIMSYSEGVDDATLVRRVYSLAFSTYARLEAISGDAHSILEKIFSDSVGDLESKLREMTCLSSDTSESIRAQLLSLGDVLVYESADRSGILIYDGEKFVLLSDGGRRVDLPEKLGRFAILRPLSILGALRCRDEDMGNLSEEETALLRTAEAYFFRGYRCQYDDSRFTRVGGGEFRWQIGAIAPEDYTRDRWGYINCAAFMYEIYRNALGMDLGALYTTYNLMEHYSRLGFTKGEPMYPFYYEPNPESDEGERARIEAEFFATLRVGDLAVIRRNNGNGHVLMYVGCGRFIHSSGSSYSYADSRETHEPTVLYINGKDYLFNPDAKNYVFSKTGFITQLGIVRPLDLFSGEIPENTRNRVKFMHGIFAEKLSSVKGGHTVRVGDKITYTFRVENLSREVRRVDICDRVAHNTEYVCGELKLNGDKLSASLEIPPSGTASVSYTVRVLLGEKICDTGATVSGVRHGVGEIFVKNTLTDVEMKKLAEVAESFVGAKIQSPSGISLVNLIYEKAGLGVPFECTNTMEIEKELFIKEEFYVFRDGGAYSDMIAPGMYGGRNLQTENRYSAESKKSTDRVRLPRRHDLLPGDVLFLRRLNDTEIYLYTGGERLLSLTDGALWDTVPLKERLEGLLAAHNYFVFFRPSMK